MGTGKDKIIIKIRCPDCGYECEITSPKYDWHRLLSHFKFS